MLIPFSMEQIYTTLTDRALDLQRQLKQSNPNVRTVIAFAGPPGSGKTTIAAQVAGRINEKVGTPIAGVLAMDGFHYTRAHLDTMPNREEAYARRGAHWTFDAEGVLDLVNKLHASRLQRTEAILAPSFDHQAKDPVIDGIRIAPQVEIVILEGNWLLLDRDPWRRISGLVDDTWFVDVDREAARQRVAARHVKAGIEATMEAALARVDGNDSLNGDEIRKCLVTPKVVVRSIEEPMTGGGETGH